MTQSCKESPGSPILIIMKLKTIPEDFIVEELIDLEIRKGDQTYFWLIKKNWTTNNAVRAIARKCGISSRRFKFAGMKDKRAVTKQAVSVFKLDKERLMKINLKDIKIEIIGTGDKPISIGSLKGNNFEIVIRDLDEKEILKLKKNIVKIRKKGFPNLFGKQRFGRGNTHLIGKSILQGFLQDAVKEMSCFKGNTENQEMSKFRLFAEKNWKSWDKILKKIPLNLNLEKQVLEHLCKNQNDYAGALRKIPKNIRKLYVHSYQSWIWNKTLEKNLIFNEELYLPGFKIKLNKNKFYRDMLKLLEKDKLNLDSFSCRRMPELALKGELRKTYINAKNIKVGDAEKDELNKKKKKIKISFSLPKGTYATVLLDFLFNIKQ